MSHDRCGIYLIECSGNGRSYVGSSLHIYGRWTGHRRDLRRGVSTCRYLQNAWNKYGEDAFHFSVLEDCRRDDLEVREQHWINTLKPRLNCITDVRRRYGEESRARNAAALRARAAAITHCPRGHEYTPENTYRNKRGKRICRACNRERVISVYANETPEQREARRQRVKADYAANRDARLAAIKAYAECHKAEKREYDQRRREAYHRA